MLPPKFQFIWLSGFSGEYLLVIDQLETGIAYCGHVYKRITVLAVDIFFY